MTDETLSLTVSRPTGSPERRAGAGVAAERNRGLWDGILHEFRNHLTLMLAVETELRQALPVEQQQVMSETFSDMVGSIHQTSLLTAALGVLRGPIEYRLSEVNELVERALELAGPLMRPGIDLVIETSGPNQLRNPGGAIQTALACLIAEMIRAADVASARRFTLRLRIHGGPNARLELQSGLPCGPQDSWRLHLVRELLATAEATLEAGRDRPGASCVITFH